MLSPSHSPYCSWLQPTDDPTDNMMKIIIFNTIFSSSNYSQSISAVHRRNPLGIIAQIAISLSGTSTIVDFSSPSTMTFGTKAQENSQGISSGNRYCFISFKMQSPCLLLSG